MVGRPPKPLLPLEALALVLGECHNDHNRVTGIRCGLDLGLSKAALRDRWTHQHRSESVVAFDTTVFPRLGVQKFNDRLSDTARSLIARTIKD